MELRDGSFLHGGARGLLQAVLVAAVLLGSCGGGQRPAGELSDEQRATQRVFEEQLRELHARVAELEAQVSAAAQRQAQVQELARRMDQLEQGSARRGRQRTEPDPALTYSVPIDGNPMVGPADAKVTLVKGYEYACFYCNKARATLDELVRKYGRELRIVYKPFVVHPSTATAPALAACAAHEQGRFAEMDELIWNRGYATKTYDLASCWESSAGCPIVTGYARELKLNLKKFQADLSGRCVDYVTREQAALRGFGISGTPAFFINGRWLSGAQPLETFSALIDEELAKATERITAGTPRAKYYQTFVVEQGLVAGAQAPAAAPVLGGQGKVLVNLKTTLGTLHCELDAARAPRTVDNFLGLATGKKEWSSNGKRMKGKPFYDGLTFHRVIPGFMIQGGDPEGTGAGGPGYHFANEIHPELRHIAGALSMANAGPDTNGSQFFITEVATPQLDGDYSVFGRCQDLDLIRKIAAVSRDASDKPLTPVTIDKVEVLGK